MFIPSKKDLKISVIVITLNEEKYIERCLANVVTNSPGIELIVIDGGSTDSTVEIARKMGAVICNSEQGRGIQANAGAALATGDILVFLHADTMLPEEVSTGLIDFFQDDNVNAGTFQLSFDVEHWTFRLFRLFSRLDPGLLRFGDQCIVVRKSFFYSIGGFPEYNLFEDIGFIRKARKKTKIYRFPMKVTTSSRRFLQNGFFKQQVTNAYYSLLYFLGVSPAKLAMKYYRSKDRTRRASLIIFVKYPHPGRVKTRISQSLGDDVAANFYRLCAEHIFQESLGLADRVNKYIFYSEGTDEHEVRQWAGNHFRFLPQIAGDLGEKIAQAMKTVFYEGASKVIIIASDVPDLSGAIIDDAIERLDRCDLVIGPTEDGGYYLLGMKRFYPELFQGVSWSTEHVFTQTMSNAGKLGLNVYSLKTLMDIDTEDDLRRWSRTLVEASHPVVKYVNRILA